MSLFQQRVACKEVSETLWFQNPINLFSCKWQQSIIFKDIKISSQNVQKNNLIVNTILETHFAFNIVFIQVLSWLTIYSILSLKNRNGEELVGVPNHPNWLMFTNTSSSINDYPRVITYVNIRLFSFQFSLHKNIYNHRDILLVPFLNNNNIFFLINIYSNSSQLALKYLKDTKVDIHNILIMTEDFNIRDSLWDSLYPHHSNHSDFLIDIMNSFSLEISYSTNSIPTRYSDNNQDSNSVIDLMFLRYGSEKLDNHIIHSDWRLSSNHTSLTITIPIVEEHIHNKKHSIIKDSMEEKSFIKDLIKDIKTINTSNLTNIDSLKNIINSFAKTIEKTWEKNSKIVNITRHLKS